MKLELTPRDLDFADLGDLEWSGSSAHLTAIAGELAAAADGGLELVVVCLANGRTVALGGVDYRRHPGTGVLWMLSVHETLQSLGIGTLLIRELEDRARRRGCDRVELGVEHDNPRAAALYRRLGYVECGTELDGWPVAGDRTYVTVCTVLGHDL